MLPGDQSDKLGNRYESWWTVGQLVEIIFGKASAIRIEAPIIEKAEFVLITPQGTELHQAKRQHHNGKWSLAELGGSQNKLLQAIHKQLVSNTTIFRFVSGSDAPELRELTERARTGPLEEFSMIGLEAKAHRDSFQHLLRIWSEPDETRAYGILTRVFVVTADEATVIQLVHSQLRSLFLAPASDIADFLRALVSDRVGETISRQQLISELEGKGFKLRRVSSTDSALSAVEACTANYVGAIRRKLIGKTLIPRKVATDLLERITSSSKGMNFVLTGAAGAGKSGCLIQFVESLHQHAIPVLAMRLDRLDPVATAYEIGLQLKLEESPALVLAEATSGLPCVLVIDQLDAVSTVSGRHADFLDAVENLLDEACGLRARCCIHVVLVCRHFDWQNDHRLRKLASENDPKFELGLFSPQEVTGVLDRAGFDPKRLSEKQLELLRLSQNLALFVDCPAAWDKLAGFGSTKELFNEYWSSKRDAVNERAKPIPESWVQITDLLVERMTDTQQLSVPREMLDAVPPGYLKQMVSEGVLSSDGARYGFGHESFFDYCFARRFVREGRTLCDFLETSEQHLFRRAQVRQVLAYLRDDDPGRYCRELDRLLRAENIRPHIKDLALSLVAAVSEVRNDEWAVLAPWLHEHLERIKASGFNSDQRSLLVWRHFFGSQSWFIAAHHRSLPRAWLSDSSEYPNNIGVHYLRFHQRQNGDAVAALLAPFADHGGEWPARLRSCMEWAEHENSRSFFGLFLRLIDNGVLDEARGPMAFGTNKSEWIPEALAHWLRRRLRLVSELKDGEEHIRRRELFGHDQAGSNHVFAAAKQHPAVLVREFLPVALEVSEFAAPESARLPRRDAIWRTVYPTEHQSFDQSCQNSLRRALGTLAKTSAGEIRAICDDLKRRTTYFSNTLLLTIFTEGAAHLADEAVTVMCAEPWRFHCGYSDSPYWIASQMIAAVTSHCSDECLGLLENAILSYVPEWEKSESGHRWIGSAARALLSSVDRKRLSTVGTRRLAELTRKFGFSPHEPRGITGGFVGSPIEKEAAEKMTDEQWLRAIAKYDSDDRKDRWKDFLKGGALQLARPLEEHVKLDPLRFGELALRFPSTTNPNYLNETLDGLKASAAPATLHLNVCRKAFADNRIACARSIVDTLAAIKEPLPDEFVAIIHWVATEHPDPEKELWKTDAGGGTPYYGGDILMAGINCTRGRAAEAIASLIWQDAEYLKRFEPTISALLNDPSLAVRVCVVNALLGVASHDEALAIKWLFQVTGGNAEILATAYGEQFLYRELRQHFPELRPMVEALLRSGLQHGEEAGARLASLSLLWGHPAEDLVQEAVDGSPSQRNGVAGVASSNLADPECRSWCEEMLRRFFEDENDKVRQTASHCFSRMKEQPLSEYEPLIEAFCDSRAYQDTSFWVLHILEESHYKLPEITVKVCEKFLARFGDEASDIRTSCSGDSGTMSKLVFRVYQQHMGSDWGSRCLGLIDTMIFLGVYGAQSGMAEFER